MPPVIGVVTYEPIRASYVLSSQGNSPQLYRMQEAATQTFKIGVPTMLSNGFMVEWTTGAANVVWGVSAEQAHSYANNGGSQGGGLFPFNPPSIDLNDPAAGPPPNQPSAVVVPIGAALRDGNVGVYGANGQTVFSIALKTGQTFTQALLVPGTFYGLTKDATSGFWFLDTTVTTGNSAVANLLGYDVSSPNDGVNGTRVFFQFKSSQREFQ